MIKYIKFLRYGGDCVNEVKKKRKIYLRLLIILNLLLWVGKFFIIAMASFEAFIGDYKNPLTTFQKAITFGKGVLIAIVIDIVINFIAVKFVNRKVKMIKYKSILYVAWFLTLIETIFILRL